MLVSEGKTGRTGVAIGSCRAVWLGETTWDRTAAGLDQRRLVVMDVGVAERPVVITLSPSFCVR